MNSGKYFYIRVGHDRRLLDLRPSGNIGLGSRSCEQHWSFEPDLRNSIIHIYGIHGLTCSLIEQESGVWLGQWMIFEKMRIILLSSDLLSEIPKTFSHKAFREQFRTLQFPDKPSHFEIIEMYRRTVASHPNDKTIIRVSNEVEFEHLFGEAPNDIHEYTLFFKLIDRNSRKQYWAKKYFGPDNFQINKELKVYDHLKSIGEMHVQFPVDLHSEYGVIFEFEQELLDAKIIHYYHRFEYFQPTEQRVIDKIGSYKISCLEDLQNKQLSELCDFQIASYKDTIRCFDFTINEWFWV